MNPAQSPRRADVAVVGRGPAGAATALMLARSGAAVVIIDRGVPRSTLGESLPPGARPMLQQLSLWDEFLAGGHRPSYGNSSTWGSVNLMESDFIRSPHENGWHIDRRALDRMLEDALTAARVPTVTGTRVLDLEHQRNGRTHWQLTLKSGDDRSRLDSDFLVDATGRSRQIVRMLDIKRCAYDRLIGAVGVLSPRSEEPDLSSFTQIEAVEDGWWYASITPDCRLVAGYMTDRDGETAKLARTREGWRVLLERTVHLRARVARFDYRLQSAIHCVSAGSSRLERVTGIGWCAVGDAAAAYDPLSSQGIFSAFTAGMWAAAALGASAADGLTEYEERLRHLYAHYLAQWLGYYALEQRWPRSPFWRYRHHALDVLFRD